MMGGNTKRTMVYDCTPLDTENIALMHSLENHMKLWSFFGRYLSHF